MAEIVGLTASVLQIGGAGAKLSIELHNFVSTASRAETEIKHIADDVKSTSQALDSVGKVLDSDDAKKLVNTDAVQHAKDLIKQCEEVFNELSDVVSKARRPAGQGKSRIGFRAKIAWPMKEQRVELLRRRLETLKSSLAVLFHVLQLAHDKARGDVELTYLEEQKQTIRSLHHQQQTSLVILQALEKKLCTDTAVPVQVSTTPVPAPTPQPVLTVFTAPTISAPNAQSQLQRNDTAEELFKDLGPDTSDTDTAMTGSEGEGEHLTVDELAQCAKQVQKLLRRITTLQESLGCGAAEGRHKRRMHKVYRRFCRKFEGAVGLDGDGRLTKTVSGETFVDSQIRGAAVTQQSAGPPQVSELQQRLALPDVAATDTGRRRRSNIAAPLSPPLDVLDMPRSSTTSVQPAMSCRRQANRRLDSRSNHYSDLYPTRPPRPERRPRYNDSPSEGTNSSNTNRGNTSARPQAVFTLGHDRTSTHGHAKRYASKNQFDELVPHLMPEYLPRASRRPVRGDHERRPVLEPPSRFVSSASEHGPPTSLSALSSSHIYYVYEAPDSESSESPSRSERTGDRDHHTRPRRKVYHIETSPRRSVPLRRRSSPRPTITERPTPARTPWSHAFVRSRRLSLDSADDGLPPPPLQVEGCLELTRARIDDRKTNVSSPSQSRQEDPLEREKHTPPLNSSPLLKGEQTVPRKEAKYQAYYSSVSDEETPPSTPNMISQPLLSNRDPRYHRLHNSSGSISLTHVTAESHHSESFFEGFLDGDSLAMNLDPLSDVDVGDSTTIDGATSDFPRRDTSIIQLEDIFDMETDPDLIIDMGGANDDWGLDFSNVNAEAERPALCEIGTKTSQRRQNDAMDGAKNTEMCDRSPSKESQTGGSITGEQPERLLAKRGEQPQPQFKGKKSKIEPEKKKVRVRPRKPSGQVPTKRRREGPTLGDVYQEYQQRAGMERAAAPQDVLAYSPGLVIEDAHMEPQDEGIVMPDTKAEDLVFAQSEKTSAEKAQKKQDADFSSFPALDKASRRSENSIQYASYGTDTMFKAGVLARPEGYEFFLPDFDSMLKLSFANNDIHEADSLRSEIKGEVEQASIRGRGKEQRQQIPDHYYDPRTSRPSAQSPTSGFDEAWHLQSDPVRRGSFSIDRDDQNVAASGKRTAATDEKDVIDQGPPCMDEAASVIHNSSYQKACNLERRYCPGPSLLEVVRNGNATGAFSTAHGQDITTPALGAAGIDDLGDHDPDAAKSSPNDLFEFRAGDDYGPRIRYCCDERDVSPVSRQSSRFGCVSGHVHWRSRSRSPHEIRHHVDSTAPVSLNLNGDMEGRTIRLVPTENGASHLVIGSSESSVWARERQERGESRSIRARERSQRSGLPILHDRRRYGLGMVGPFGRSERGDRTVVGAAPAPILDAVKNNEQDGEPMDIVDVLLERWTRPVSCG